LWSRVKLVENQQLVRGLLKVLARERAKVGEVDALVAELVPLPLSVSIEDWKVSDRIYGEAHDILSVVRDRKRRYSLVKEIHDGYDGYIGSVFERDVNSLLIAGRVTIPLRPSDLLANLMRGDDKASWNLEILELDHRPTSPRKA
jgi:hypothetical protein